MSSADNRDRSDGGVQTDASLEGRFAPFFRKMAEEGLTAEAGALILSLIERLVPFELGTLWLRHGHTYVPGASIGRPMDLLEGLPFSSGEGMAAWIAEAGKPVRIPSSSRGFRHETLRAFLGVPLLCAKEPQGVIEIAHTTRLFSEREHDLLVQIADLLAPAIRHGRIAGRLRDLALVDPLTELFNRRYFVQQFDVEIDRARANNADLGFLRFELNRPRGEPVTGAPLLKSVAALRAAVRSTDVLARLEAGTLGLLVPGASASTLVQIGRRLSEIIGVGDAGNGRALALVTRGVSYPADGTTSVALLEACRRAAPIWEVAHAE